MNKIVVGDRVKSKRDHTLKGTVISIRTETKTADIKLDETKYLPEMIMYADLENWVKI